MEDGGFGLARNERGTARSGCHGCDEGAVAGGLAAFLGDGLVGVSGDPQHLRVSEGVGGFREILPSHLRVKALNEGYWPLGLGAYGFQACVAHTVGEGLGTGNQHFGARGNLLREKLCAGLRGADDSFCPGVHSKVAQVFCDGFYRTGSIVSHEDDRYVELFLRTVEGFGSPLDGEGAGVDNAVQV